jgi:hypothetical protein
MGKYVGRYIPPHSHDQRSITPSREMSR